MQTIAIKTGAADGTDQPSGRLFRADLIVMLVLSGAFALLIALWFAFDRRVPPVDEAGHILNALDCKALFHHAKPFKFEWWHQLLSVNQFYPPFVYILNGSLKLVLGNGRWVDVLSLAAFSCTLTCSTFVITRMLSRSLFGAIVAGCVVNLCPLTASLSHNFLLDFPVTAMVALGLFSLMFWRQQPNWRSTIVSGCMLAAACMTKQIVAAYLILPGLLCLIFASSKWQTDKQPDRIAQVATMAVMVLATFLPWFAVNYAWIHGYAGETAAALRDCGGGATFWGCLATYFCGFWFSMSPLLVATLLVSLAPLRIQDHRKLLPMYLSAAGGLALLSCVSFTVPMDRYTSGILVAAAVATGYGASIWYQRGARIARIAYSIIGVVAAFQFMLFFYAPYPLPIHLEPILRVLGVQLREPKGLIVTCGDPYAGGLDWQQNWILDTIAKRDPGKPVYLNILPADGIYNPHSFELLARERGLRMRPTTSRVWTIVGDQVKFSPKTALYFQWYLLKTGDQGNKLKDAGSQFSYQQLQSFVQDGGNFELVGDRILPDGAKLDLYRQHN